MTAEEEELARVSEENHRHRMASAGPPVMVRMGKPDHVSVEVDSSKVWAYKMAGWVETP